MFKGWNFMSTRTKTARSPFKLWVVKIHRWLGVGAAIFWLIEALTGIFLGFHFEMTDAALSTAHRPTDPSAIEERIETIATATPDSKVHWIWTTAGLPDRYVILFSETEGTTRKAYIDGGGDILRNRPADEPPILGLLLNIHINLLSGRVGHWILIITGALLFTNLITGLIASWPRKGQWHASLVPSSNGTGPAKLFSWHRAVGLWAVIPALLTAGTGTLILLEGPIRNMLNAPEITFPVNPATGPEIGYAAASNAAVNAIPGSRFVGTTLPTLEDATYYAWVRAPGELYRGGYGGSLVVVDANDATIRGAYPATDAKAAYAFIGSFYPLHTGEFAGLFGRVLVTIIGVWLAVTIVLGILLWWKRRPARKLAEKSRS